MADFPIHEFELLVHEFLLGKKSWDDLHHFVTDAEVKNTTEIPTGHPDSSVLGELTMAFLADSRDDPQFLLTKQEVQDLFNKLQSSRRRRV